MGFNNNNLFRLEQFAQSAGYETICEGWPDIALLTKTGQEPILVRNVYTGPGRRKTKEFEFNAMKFLQTHYGADIKVCFNSDVTKLYTVEEVLADPYTLSHGTLAVYKTKWKKLTEMIREMPDGVARRELEMKAAELQAALIKHKVLKPSEPAPAMLQSLEWSAEAIEQRRQKALNEAALEMAELTGQMHLLDDEVEKGGE